MTPLQIPTPPVQARKGLLCVGRKSERRLDCSVTYFQYSRQRVVTAGVPRWMDRLAVSEDR